MTRIRRDGRTCRIRNCPRSLYALDLCDAHYRRQRLHGDPEVHRPLGGPKLIPAELDAVISGRQRELWTRNGWLRPEKTSSGRYRWDDTEIQIAVLIARIAETGLPLATAARAARSAVVKGKTDTVIAKGVMLRVDF